MFPDEVDEVPLPNELATKVLNIIRNVQVSNNAYCAKKAYDQFVKQLLCLTITHYPLKS